MLLGALGHHPYDYYRLLRWIVCGVAAFAAFRASERNKNGGWVWVLAFVALLFNPIIPVHLERETWAFIDVGVAVLLLISIVAVDLPPAMKGPLKAIVRGLLLVFLALWFWYYMLGNPLDELALIRSGKTVAGLVIDTWEDAWDDDRGRTHWVNGASYKYTLPNGREFTQRTQDEPRRLKEEFRNLKQPYPIEVEYLPDKPAVSRRKGDGCQNVLEWLWQKALLGSLLPALFVSPGIAVLLKAVRDLKNFREDALLNQYWERLKGQRTPKELAKVNVAL